jgi:ADP-ribosylation factor-like protein 3
MGQGSSNSRPPRVLVVGLDGAGKTCLLRRLARQEIALTAPTHGFQIVRLEFGGKPVELIDVGGREELRAQWHVYYRGLAGLVFVLDAADKRRLEEAGVELNKLLCEPLLAHVPTLIVANKHDVIDALPAHKVRARARKSGRARRSRVEWHGLRGCTFEQILRAQCPSSLAEASEPGAHAHGLDFALARASAL